MNPVQRKNTDNSDVEMNVRDPVSSSLSKCNDSDLNLSNLTGSWHLLYLMGIYNSLPCNNMCRISLFLEYSQWIACVSMILNGIVTGVRKEAVIYDKVTATVWVVQCCVQYSILRRAMLNDCLPLKTIIDMGSRHAHEKAGCMHKNAVVKLSSAIAYVCIIFAMVNVTLAAGAYFHNFFYRVIPLTNHMAWNLLGIVLWLVYSYSWFTPLLFVVVPAHLLTQRVHALADYIAINRTLPNFDIDRTMDWYDDLHDLNRLLQRSVSPMATVALAIGGPLQILVMMSFVLQYGSVMAALIWSVTNGILLFVIAGSLARLEIINRRLQIDLAGLRSRLQCLDPAKHALIITKVTSLRFGVTFFRTTTCITFSGMFTLTSFISSAFIFLIGLAHVSKA